MRVIKGLVGWSNKRYGLEFYRYDPKVIPRHGSEWGDLLAQELDEVEEGCPIVIVIMSRNATEIEVNEMANGIAGQTVEYN